MPTPTPQQLALTIARLSDAFMSNYMRALQRAQIEATDVSELNEDALARILQSASQQNAEMAEYFAEQLQVDGNAEWNAAVERWKSSILDQAAFMRDANHSAEAKIIKFLTLGAEGSEVAFELNAGHGHGGGHGGGSLTLTGLLGPASQVLNVALVLKAWQDGDWGQMAGVTAGALTISFLGGFAAGLAAGAVVAAPVAILIGVAIVTIGYFTGSEVRERVNERLGITDGELDLQYLARFVGDPRFQMEPTTGHRLQFGEYTDDVLTGLTNVRNAISGSGGADIISGGDLSDFLSGGNGADTLTGGAGSDLMRGGDGFDTYRFVTDDLVGESTHDIIADSDGQGVILFNGLNIAGTGAGLDHIRHASLGAYETPDGQFRITLVNAGQPDQALIFLHRATNSTITVRNWQNGDLGITLPSQPETPQPTAVTHTGSVNADYLNPNIGTTPATAPVHAEGDRGRDMLFGTRGDHDDELNGGDGNDIIVGNGGADRIDGGRDNDFLSGFGDDSVVHGGDGDDVVAADYQYGFEFYIDESLPIDEGTVWRDLQQYFDWQGSSAFSAGENGSLEARPTFGLGGDFNFTGASSHEGWSYRFWRDTDGNYRLMYFSPEKPEGFYLGGDGVIRFRNEGATFQSGVSLYGDAGNDDLRGGNASDYIDGGADNDRIGAGGGNDVVVGGSGEDEIAGGAGDDVIDGGADADDIYGEQGGDTIFGGAGNDRLWGDMHDSVSGVEGGNDTIDGGAGNDEIAGQGGNDTLSGGAGDDRLFGGDGDDSLLGGTGADQLQGAAGNDGLFGGDGQDRLLGEDGDDLMDGGADNDLMAGGDGNDILEGGSGSDELSGNAGNDQLSGGYGYDILAGGDGDDQLDGGSDDDALYGEGGNDNLAGGAQADTLYGGDGNDLLDGGSHNDQLWGGNGNDRLIGGDGVDQLAGGSGNDTLDGGGGVDSVYGDGGNDRLSGGDGDDYLDGDAIEIAASEHGADEIDGGAGNDLIHGLGGDDTVRGGDGDDRVFGDDYERVFSGNDTVEGGAGNDYVDGGAGDDVLNGGSGDDVLFGGTGDDRFHFEAGWGADSILRLDATGAGLDRISFGAGIALSDLTFSVRGQDLVITRSGGADNIYVQGYFAHGLNVALQFDGGIVATREQIAQILGIGATTGGTAGGDTLTGTEGVDRIHGGDGNDTINGLGGDDYLNGGEGNDTLIGGQGDDNLEGGAGNDTYVFELGSGVDRIIGLDAADAGADVIRFGASLPRDQILSVQASGNDLMISFRNGSGPGAGLGETVVLEGFLSPDNRGHVIEFADGSRMTASDFSNGATDWTGTDADETYYGSNANNRLEGRGGVDRLFGMDGADTLEGGDGNDLLDGGGGNDQLRGGTGADLMIGGDGDDLLDGDEWYANQQYADTMRGGAGNDTYLVGAAYQYNTTADIVVEQANEGIDTVRAASYSYTLTDNVENLVAEYRGDYYYWQNPSYPGWIVNIPRQLVGNALDNRIEFAPLFMGQSHTGRYYVLDGGAGADTLIGTGGHDTYVVDQAGDVIVEPEQSPFMQESIDTVRASYSYSLAWNEHLENVELIGNANLSATGNTRNNRLDGSLSAGANSLSGGLGDDTYVITAEDSVVEAAGEGNDTVVIERLDETSVSGQWFDLANYANVENLTIGNNVAIDWDYNGSESLGAFRANLRGDAGDNRLLGNGYSNEIRGGDGNDSISGGEREPNSSYAAERDLLFGEGGNDSVRAGSGGATLSGGSGNDELYGGSGHDIFVYAAGDGADLIVAGGNGGRDSDRLEFAAGIDVDDLSWNRVGDDLVIQVGADAANTITVRNYWDPYAEGDDVLYGAIEQFVFADGTVRSGGLDELRYANTPPVAHVNQLNLGVADETAFEYALPQGTFSDPDGDVLVYSLGSDAPAWLSIDAATGRISGTAPDGSASYSLAIVATDIRGRSASTLLTIDVRNVVRGTAGDDTLQGSSGSDELLGLAGNDRLVGNGGADRLVGGSGNDTYVVDDVGQVVVEQAGEGDDTVESQLQSYALSDNVENLRLVEGSGAFEAIGNAAANHLYGNNGDNRLDGGAGADVLQGGAGDDYYVVDNLGDQVTEAAGAGSDTIESGLSWQLGANVENLLLVGAANINGTGNALANEIEGNDGNNRLDGGAGADRLRGGAGDDYYVVDVAQDQVFEQADGGTDTLERRYETNLVLATQIENLVLGTGVVSGNGNNRDNVVTGNASNNKLMGLDGNDRLLGLDGADQIWAGTGNDVLLGGNGNDYLDGGAGDDRFEGGAGDDNYVMAGDGSDVVDNTGGGSDRIIFTSGLTRARLSFLREGNDLLILVDGAFPPVARVNNHFLGGDAAIDFVQADGGTVLTAAQINQLVASGSGSPFDQVLTGTANGERIDGGNGRDLIRGMAGNDILLGGLGDDTLQGGDGDDTLQGGRDGAVGTPGEASGADRLEGGAGHDSLSGGNGRNTLIGGSGNDSYIVGMGEDIVDNTGGGIDSLRFSATQQELSFTRVGDDLVIALVADPARSVRVLNHFLGGDAAIDFVELSGGNALDGAAIQAIIDAGSGNGDYTSVVTGTDSDEQLLGSDERDLVQGLGGADELFGFANDDKLDGGLGDDYLAGGNGSGTGSGNDILIGGAGSDTLYGEDGDDAMFGGSGNDYYAYGGGSDTVDNTGGGTDWLLFNSSGAPINRNRLSFHRDGNDLIVRVDGDGAQQVRVINHFLGGDWALDYVQPGDGNAIPASQFGALLAGKAESQQALDGLISAMSAFAPAAGGPEFLRVPASTCSFCEIATPQ